MWIPQYHRAHLPVGVDHSAWGAPLAAHTLSDYGSTAGIIDSSQSHQPLRCEASLAVDVQGQHIEPPPRFLQETDATFNSVVTKPITGVTFMPDHAVIVEEGQSRWLATESLWHSYLYFSSWFRNDRSTNWQWVSLYNGSFDIEYDQPVNHCYHRFGYQYFHWFIDVLPRVWLLKKHGSFGASAGWFVGSLEQSFQVPSLELFDVGVDDCIFPELPWPDSPAAMRNGPIVKFNQMIYPGFTFNEGLGTRPSYDTGLHYKGWSKEYLTELKDRAAVRFPRSARGKGTRIYITRRNAAHRRVLNEDAVWKVLEPLGFQPVDPGAMGFEEQVRIFSAASTVVGVHGAGLTNIIWPAASCSVVELMPAMVDDIGYRFLCNMLGHRHTVLLCRQTPHPVDPSYADIEVDADALRGLLREVLN